jgi:RND family efflux transporter MFP subunit
MNKQILSLVLLLAPLTSLAVEIELTKEQLNNINLTTAIINTRENSRQLQLSGLVTADRLKTHRVAPVIGGIVVDLRVVEHEKVSKGQILARLRSHKLGEAQAEYLESLARYSLLKGERKRIDILYKEGIVSETRWRKIDSEFIGAQANLEARRRLLSITGLTKSQIVALSTQQDTLAEFNLISPIDGIVTQVDVESGQLIDGGQAAFHIDDLSVLWAMVKIPVANLAQIEAGVDADIAVKARPGKSYSGKLKSLGAEVDMQSQTLTGRIVLDNPSGELLPGMYAEVNLNTVTNQGIMAPASAVFRLGNEAYLFKILGEGRFEPVAIKIGAEANGWIPVLRGIETGTKVISSGVAELKSHWQYQGGE